MPPERRPRRRVRKRRRILPRLLIALIVALALGTVGSMLVRSGKKSSAPPTLTKSVQSTRARRQTPSRSRCSAISPRKVTGSLPAALMDPSYVASGGGIVLLGGLNAADTSVDTVIAAGYHGASVIGRLPSVRHDTAAAVINRTIYVFGGGNGPSQLADIVRVDPRTGARA